MIHLIKNQIDKNDNIIKSYPLQDINTYKKIDKSEYFKAINQQKNLEGALDNPYFGRLDIEYKEDNEKETVYIERRRVDIGDDIIVYSWAAPIADIYQKYNSGEYKRKCVDKDSGKEILLEGNILGKRKISINKGKVTDVYSYNTITEDDEEEFAEVVLKRKIENNIINNDEIYKEQSILKTSKRFKLYRNSCYRRINTIF